MGTESEWTPPGPDEPTCQGMTFDWKLTEAERRARAQYYRKQAMKKDAGEETEPSS